MREIYECDKAEALFCQSSNKRRPRQKQEQTRHICGKPKKKYRSHRSIEKAHHYRQFLSISSRSIGGRSRMYPISSLKTARCKRSLSLLQSSQSLKSQPITIGSNSNSLSESKITAIQPTPNEFQHSGLIEQLHFCPIYLGLCTCKSISCLKKEKKLSLKQTDEINSNQ